MPVEGRRWVAHRISVLGPERCDRIILAHSREEAMAQAYALFGAVTPAEKTKIYVREM